MENNSLLIFDTVHRVKDFFTPYFYGGMRMSTKININPSLILNLEETASVRGCSNILDKEGRANVTLNVVYCQFLWGMVANVAIRNLYHDTKCSVDNKERYARIVNELSILINNSQIDVDYMCEWDMFMRKLESKEFFGIEIITIYAISFILAHECSHLELKHSESEDKEEEFAADASAFWHTIIHEDNKNTKEHLVIAISSVFLSLIFLNGTQDSDSHPAPHKRLYAYLNSIDDVGDDVWQYCCNGFDLNPLGMNCVCERLETTTAKEHFMNIIETFSLTLKKS